MRFKTIFFALPLFLFSCRQNDDDITNNKKGNITLIYMIADNDLAPFALADINEMERTFIPSDDEKVLVYIDSSPTSGLPQNPVLLEIQHDDSDVIKSKILVSYPQQNSTDKEVFSSILKDAFEYNNILNKPKGLILWSHGNAWLPDDYTLPTNNKAILQNNIDDRIFFKYFGKDYSPKESVMNIHDLSEALKPYHFKYIIFDACFMGSIEVMYELRHRTEYFIVSPTEILSLGFPYDRIIPRITQPSVNLVEICKDFYNFYADKKGVYKSASITLIDSYYLDDLASYCKHTFSASGSFSIDEKYQKELQQYTRNNEQILYDLKQLIEISDNKYPNWEKLVLYNNKTEYMAGTLSLKNCNGISSYIFGKKNNLNEYYKTLSWYKNTGFNPIFIND